MERLKTIDLILFKIVLSLLLDHDKSPFFDGGVSKSVSWESPKCDHLKVKVELPAALAQPCSQGYCTLWPQRRRNVETRQWLCPAQWRWRKQKNARSECCGKRTAVTTWITSSRRTILSEIEWNRDGMDLFVYHPLVLIEGSQVITCNYHIIVFQLLVLVLALVAVLVVVLVVTAVAFVVVLLVVLVLVLALVLALGLVLLVVVVAALVVVVGVVVVVVVAAL